MQPLLSFRRRTKDDRFNLSKQERSPWQERADDAVLGSGSRTAEIGDLPAVARSASLIWARATSGCGMSSRASFTTPHTYTGYDLEPQQRPDYPA